MKKIPFAELSQVTQDILQSGKRLLYVAGASASGKTYIAEQIAQQLEAAGKKVLTVSSDNYYVSDSGVKSFIFGTYDHPKLIEYDLLAKNIEEYFSQGSFMLPEYSFAESRRSKYTKVDKQADILIVEGLYTISQLPTQFATIPEINDPYKIYITAAEEDLIVRRLLRDPVRVGEPLHMIIQALNNVFPMWNLYGITQEALSDITIINDYNLLAKDGKKMLIEPYYEGLLEGKQLYTTEQVTEYTYNDSSEDANGKLLVTEYYQEGMLKSIGIAKTSSLDHNEKGVVQHITMRIYKPGILTLVHSLVQNAGLKYEGVTHYTEQTYVDTENKHLVLEDRVTGKRVRHE